jgi:hypothetical protein
MQKGTAELRSRSTSALKPDIEQTLGKEWINESQAISKMLYGLMMAINPKN